METLKFKENEFICSYKGGLKTCSYEELLAVECDKPLVKFRLKECILVVKGSLSSVEDNLSACFIRINRQVVVNMKRAKQIVVTNGEYWLHLMGDIEYKISERRRKDVYTAYLYYLATISNLSQPIFSLPNDEIELG